jgi:RNA polymerase sigma factor (sigma-70 family)
MMDVCPDVGEFPVGAAAEPLLGDSSAQPPDDAERVYLKFAPILRRIALRKYEVPLPEVDALVNDVFATYLTNPDDVRDVERYLVAGVCNASRDFWRRRNREVSLDAVEHVTFVEDAVEGLPERLLLAAALARLRSRCRTILFRYYFEGEKTEVIAADINTSPGNVLYLLHQCRARAKRILHALLRGR